MIPAGRALALVSCASLLALGASSARPHLEPELFLWAWERPEDLRFLETPRTGVAFLAKTLRLRGNGVAVRPRLPQLRFRPGTPLLAVVRIEVDRLAPPRLSAAQRARAAAEILDLTRHAHVAGVQVDFDATRSQRAFYRALVADLRAGLPPGRRLSITALASWCLWDDWIADLPVDEAVPMLFEMGPETSPIRRHLEAGGDFRAPLCRGSVGVAAGEPLRARLSPRRVYVFSAVPWSAASARSAAAWITRDLVR